MASATPASGGAPLHVLLTGDCVGGVWTYLLDLAGGLSAAGIRTTLAVLGPKPPSSTCKEARRIPGLTLIPTGLGLDWTAADRHEVIGAAGALSWLARDVGADLVHLHSAAYAGLASFHAPVVVGCHSCVSTWWTATHGSSLPPDLAWRAVLMSHGIAAADDAIAPSRAFARATAAAYGLRVEPTVVLNGRAHASALHPEIKIRHFLGSQCEGGEAGTSVPTIDEVAAFTAGRLWDVGKNLLALDAAAPRAGLPILAAGDLAGPNGAAVTLPNLRCLGRLSAAEIAACLAARPIFVSSALYEPFGLAVLEAAAAGCPLVLSDIPTFRELWDGAAVFVDPRDPDAIAAALRRLAGSADERKALSTRAAARADSYGVDRMVAGTLAVYRRVLRADRCPDQSLVA